jgi:hypothetical protein
MNVHEDVLTYQEFVQNNFVHAVQDAVAMCIKIQKIISFMFFVQNI